MLDIPEISIITNMYILLLVSNVCFAFYSLHTSQTFKFKIKLEDIFNFLKEMLNQNPLLLDYSYSDFESDNEQATDKIVSLEKSEKVEEKTFEKYEDKYLTKFKNFPNDFSFNDADLEYENAQFLELKNIQDGLLVRLKDDYECERDNINFLLDLLSNCINKNNCTLDESSTNKIVQYFGIETDYKEHGQSYFDAGVFTHYCEILLDDRNKINETIKSTQENILNDEQLRLQAKNNMINNKLNKLINSYVLEYTPLGNVYMRYNNDKKSFEYFSNNTLPYRYLEVVGRKYVTTFWCKPIFVDIETELKNAELKYDEQQKSGIKPQQTQTFKKPIEMTSKPMKNRNVSNMPLPQQLKASLNVEKNMKQILKENANRYTWEGRLNDMKILQKVEIKQVKKSLEMTYAEFKKFQQENKIKNSV